MNSLQNQITIRQGSGPNSCWCVKLWLLRWIPPGCFSGFVVVDEMVMKKETKAGWLVSFGYLKNWFRIWIFWRLPCCDFFYFFLHQSDLLCDQVGWCYGFNWLCIIQSWVILWWTEMSFERGDKTGETREQNDLVKNKHYHI